ncbi:MAG: 6-bladed beta-propeller [Tannerellaceae bacterium]|jgi:hypothetical protein|nr:6-bladed beta-propeller [Tannerellaceae bacterium]
MKGYESAGDYVMVKNAYECIVIGLNFVSCELIADTNLLNHLIMTTHVKSFLLPAAIAVLFACNEAPQANYLEDAPVVAARTLPDGEEFIELNPSLLKDTVIFPLSYFTEELQIIKLDDRDEALVNPYRVYMSENYFLTHASETTPCKLFDKQGRYLADIGSFGQGPGEYRYLYAGQIDEPAGRIYLMPYGTESLLVYDLEGNVLPPVPLAYKAHKSLFLVRDNEVLVMGEPHPDIPSFIWVQDLKGNKLYDIPSSLDFPFDYSTEVLSSLNGDAIDFSHWTWTPRADSLYHIDLVKKKLIPRFTASFKGEALKPHMYTEWPGYFLGSTSTIVTVSMMDESGNMQMRKEGDEPAYYIVDKKTLKGAYFGLVNDFLGEERFNQPIFLRNGYYLSCVDPGDLEERIEKALASDRLSDKMRQKLTEVQANMTANDNNYILYAKLKGAE